MNLQNLSQDSLIMDEEYDYSQNPFYVLATEADDARLKMFELVEIPHLCLEMNRCRFSYDMQCIKKAHQYMKQSISSSYYYEIKKNLQKLLSVLIRCQQQFTEAYDISQRDLNHNDYIQQHIISSLCNYFQNSSSQKFNKDSLFKKISIENFSTDNNINEFHLDDHYNNSPSDTNIYNPQSSLQI